MPSAVKVFLRARPIANASGFGCVVSPQTRGELKLAVLFPDDLKKEVLLPYEIFVTNLGIIFSFL